MRSFLSCWHQTLEKYFQLLRLLGWGSYYKTMLVMCKQSSFSFPGHGDSFVVELHTVSFASLSNNLEQAVPCLIHSTGLQISSLISLCSLHHWPEKVVFITLRYCLVPSWGQRTNGLWSLESTSVFSPSLGRLPRLLVGQKTIGFI